MFKFWLITLLSEFVILTFMGRRANTDLSMDAEERERAEGYAFGFALLGALSVAFDVCAAITSIIIYLGRTR